MTTAQTVQTRIPYWNDHLQPGGYSSTRLSRGPDGHLHRHDCSGYVSMLLGWAADPYTGAMVGSEYVTLITRAQLRFGDLLIALPGGGHDEGHVVMFDHWTDQAHYFGHEWGEGPAPEHRVITWPYNDPNGGQDTRTFRPYRPKILTGATELVGGSPDYGPWYTGAAASRNLAQLDQGEDVKSLQVTLNKWYPHRTPLWVDGQYGPLTGATVKYNQGRAKLPATGKVDRATWRELGYTLHY